VEETLMWMELKKKKNPKLSSALDPGRKSTCVKGGLATLILYANKDEIPSEDRAKDTTSGKTALDPGGMSASVKEGFATLNLYADGGDSPFGDGAGGPVPVEEPTYDVKKGYDDAQRSIELSTIIESDETPKEFSELLSEINTVLSGIEETKENL
jgi:hypothetical protein